MKNYYKYLTVNPIERKWEFYVTTVGYSKIRPDQIYPPTKGHPSTHFFSWDNGRILNGYYIVFIVNGKGLIQTSLTSTQRLTGGNCFFLFPQVWHRYKPKLDIGWEEYWVGFNGNYPKNIMNKDIFNTKNPIVTIPFKENLVALFNRLIETVKNSSPGYRQIISGITLEILGIIYKNNLYNDEHKGSDVRLIHETMFYLRESTDKQVNIKTLSSDLPMGYSKFRKLFKSISGLSPLQYQLNYKIKKAKALLQNSNLNINEIAHEVGFNSIFHFSNAFKKNSGMSPSRYRTLNR